MQIPNRSLKGSQNYFRRAQKLIPSCTQTFSKGYTQFVQGVAPIFLQRGQGSHVWDVDGNEYIDYPMALGPIILGYNDPDVTAAVQRQISEGVTFSLPHPLEIEVAELLTEVIPCAEMVRFGKSGSDATSGAVRAARAYTGRDKIACCGYHGWQDWYIGTTPRNKGVPQPVRDLTLTFQYNDIGSLEKLFNENSDQIAGVILEPIGVIKPERHFLQKVAELTRKYGALLIFDEVVTGFRLALGGAQEYFGVIPDLACLGKAMANGHPISAIVGKREIMEIFDEIFFSSTFGGETLSLAAAQATITKMRDKQVISHLWRQGQKLQDGYNALAAEFGLSPYTQCIGLAPHTVLTFRSETSISEGSGADSLAMRSLFQQEMIKRGVLFLVGFNLCYSHGDADVEYTLEACREALGILARAMETHQIEAALEGTPVQPVFRRA